MRVRPRCQSSPTCVSTGISTSWRRSSGRRTAASRESSWSRPMASYSRSAVRSAVVSSGVRRAGTAADGAAAPAAAAEVAQLIVAEPGQPPDAVSLFDGAVEEPQARDVGFRVHPAAIVTGRRDGAVAALPGTQRVDADPGQLGDGADRIARRAPRVVCSSSHDPDGRRARRPTPPLPTPMSASVSTNGHCRSVE